MEIEEENINEKDCWKVIDSFFNSYGLVSQQINSFNQFIEKNIQEIIDENKTIIIKPDIDYSKMKDKDISTYELTFGKSYLYRTYPHFLEKNNFYRLIYPSEARIRNLDYSSQLKANIILKENKNGKIVMEQNYDINIGKIPIMIKSNFCSLNKDKDKNIDSFKVKECEYDQGGYFIIGGGEKVIIAQERMATNFVYVSKKKELNGFTWQAEIKSSKEGENNTPTAFYLKITDKSNSKKMSGKLITAKIPYVKDDIPISILFRALGVETDKDIMDYIVYDKKDNTLKEIIKPSLLNSKNFFTRRECLEYIGNKLYRNTLNDNPEVKIRKAEENLTKYLLPHISTKKSEEYKKLYFIGYMINRLVNCYLGRTSEDDRDHYGKKRLDMCGVLLSELFQKLFKEFINKAKLSLKNQLETIKKKRKNLKTLI